MLDCCIKLTSRVNLHEPITYRYAVTSRRRARFLVLICPRVEPHRSISSSPPPRRDFPKRKTSSQGYLLVVPALSSNSKPGRAKFAVMKVDSNAGFDIPRASVTIQRSPYDAQDFTNGGIRGRSIAALPFLPSGRMPADVCTADG
jgi:hypothetical protein